MAMQKHCRKRVNWWVCCLLLGLSLEKSCEDMVLAENTKATAFPGALTLQDGKLTARLAAVPLRQVITEISRLSGAQVSWLGQQDESPVSADFSALPVVEALERLLRRKNFLLLYASSAQDARLTQIWISSVKTAPEFSLTVSQTAPPLQSQASIDEPEPDVEDEDSGTAPEEEFDDSQAQARMIDAALERVTTSQSSARSAETIEMLEGYAQEDPRIRATLTQLAHDSSDLFVQRTAAEALAKLP
jgi:hypothetical protein